MIDTTSAVPTKQQQLETINVQATAINEKSLCNPPNTSLRNCSSTANSLTSSSNSVPVHVTSFIPRSNTQVAETSVIQYRDLLNEFGIADSDSSESSSQVNTTCNSTSKYTHLLNSDYDEPKDMIRTSRRRKSGSSPGNLNKPRSIRQYEATSSDYDEPNSTSNDEKSFGKRNSSSLPTNLEFSRLKNTTYAIIHAEPKKKLDLSLKLPEIDHSKDSSIEGNNLYCKLPPRQIHESRSRKTSWSPMSQKKRRLPNSVLERDFEIVEHEPIEPDYDDVFVENEPEIMARSKSLDGHVPRSAPVTPTDVKPRPPFCKILRKRHIPVYRESITDAVLVRVSSLPDQDLLNVSNEQLNDNKSQNSGGSTLTKKKRSISPLTLSSDITAKRLSESDKNVSQISPVKCKTFNLLRRNDVAVGCDLPVSNKNTSDSSIESGKSEKIKIDQVKATGDDQNSRSASVSTKQTDFKKYFIISNK